MRHADCEVIEGAAELVLHRASRPEQADLLSILGVFAEPVIAVQEFTRMIGRERLMESKLIEYLAEEKIAEATAKATAEAIAATERKYEAERRMYEAERQKAEAERAVREERLRHEATVEALQFTLEEVIVTRFPQAPAILLHELRPVEDPDQLHSPITAAAGAPDVSTLTERVRSITGAGGNGPPEPM